MNSNLLIPNAERVLILYPPPLPYSNDVPYTVCELQTAATAESPPIYRVTDLCIPLRCNELKKTYTELSRWLFNQWPKDSSPNDRILVISGSQSNIQNIRLLLNIGNAFLKESNSFAQLSKTEVCHFTLTTKERRDTPLLRLACMTQEIWEIIAIHRHQYASPTRYHVCYSNPTEFFEMGSRRPNAI